MASNIQVSVDYGYESGNDDVAWRLRRKEASDDEEEEEDAEDTRREKKERRVRYYHMFGGDDEDSDGLGLAEEYIDDNDDDLDAFDQEKVEEEGSIILEGDRVADVTVTTVAKESSATAAVKRRSKIAEKRTEDEAALIEPRIGEFFMHDDRYNARASGRGRQFSRKKLWPLKDEAVWIHDKFKEMALQERSDEGRKNFGGYDQWRKKTWGRDRGKIKSLDRTDNQGQSVKHVKGKGPVKYKPLFRSGSVNLLTYDKHFGKTWKAGFSGMPARTSNVYSSPPSMKQASTSSKKSALPVISPASSLNPHRSVKNARPGGKIRDFSPSITSEPQNQALLQRNVATDSKARDKLYMKNITSHQVAGNYITGSGMSHQSSMDRSKFKGHSSRSSDFNRLLEMAQSPSFQQMLVERMLEALPRSDGYGKGKSIVQESAEALFPFDGSGGDQRYAADPELPATNFGARLYGGFNDPGFNMHLTGCYPQPTSSENIWIPPMPVAGGARGAACSFPHVALNSGYGTYLSQEMPSVGVACPATPTDSSSNFAVPSARTDLLNNYSGLQQRISSTEGTGEPSNVFEPFARTERSNVYSGQQQIKAIRYSRMNFVTLANE